MDISNLTHDITSMMSLVWGLAMLGLQLTSLGAIIRKGFRGLSRLSFLQADQTRSFGSPDGVEETTDYHLMNIWIILKSGIERRESLRTTDMTCKKAEDMMYYLGREPYNHPLATRLTHGLVIISSVVVVEVLMFGVVLAGGFGLYALGVEVDLIQMYELAVAFLLLLTFSTLFEANQRLPDVEVL